MTFDSKSNDIEKRITNIKRDMQTIKRIMTKKTLLPNTNLNKKEKKLINNFINKKIIKNKINNLQSKRQTTIGMTNNVKRLTNLNLQQQKTKLIETYEKLAKIQKELLGEKRRSSKSKKKKKTQNKRKKHKIKEKNKRQKIPPP